MNYQRGSKMRKRGRASKLFLSNILVFILVLSVFSSFGFAQTDATTTTIVATGVDTIIVVNSGDVSTIDAAIAAGISADTGIPVLYVEHDDALQVIEQLKTTYADVENVVILGGEAVVSSDVQNFLETSGAVSGNYEVTRIAGTTGTGTAVEAIDYFYGPGMTDEVTIVAYEGDHNYEGYNEVLHLAAQLGNPIIPMPVVDVDGSPLGGLPAEVVETLELNGIDSVDIIGDFQGQGETEVKNDLQEIGATINNEINGVEPQQIEEQLVAEIIEDVQPGENVEITFVEEGDVPPISPDENHLVFYYKDENNDNVDDESGQVLGEAGLELYDQITEKGANVEGITCTGDDPNVWSGFEAEMERRGELVDLVEYTDDNMIEVGLKIHEEEADRISDEFKEGDDEWKDLAEAHKAEFAAALPSMTEMFKAYYISIKDTLPPEAVELGAKIIDEANKGDAVTQWKLMHAFANAEGHREYVENCHDNTACRNEHIEMENEDTDEALEKLVGTDKAREVANLDVGVKVGLLGMDMFVAPSPEEEAKFEADLTEVLAAGATVESLPVEYVDDIKEEAYTKYAEELKQEYEAAGKSAEEVAKLTPEYVETIVDNRLTIESEAYLSGTVSYSDYIDPVKRAEIMANMESVHQEFESKGIEDTHYLTPEYWKGAYEKYTTTGSLSADFVKECEAAVTGYRTWEYDHIGSGYDPVGAVWDAKKGTFSYTDEEGRVVAGVYKDGYYRYANEEGELIEGHKDGEFKEYREDHGGWKYDETTATWKSPDGKTYTPPSSWDPTTQTYAHYNPHDENARVYCGGKGCEVGVDANKVTQEEGWKYDESAKTWTSPDGHSYSGYTSYYSYSGSGEYAGAGGETWTQSPDGTWSSSGGATYSGGHEGSYTYTSPSGETSYSGGTTTYSSGGDTSTSSGTYSGTGTYSGGTTSSTGTTDSGGGSAPSGGGDTGGHSGGGETGHVIAGYALYDSEYTRGLLSKWLFGEG